MLWRGREQSTNVEDRRGGRGGMARNAGGLGLGAIILMFFIYFLGGDPTALMQNMQQGGGGAAQQQNSPQQARPDDELAGFVKVVLKETEDVWNKLFPAQLGRNYREPTLVIFDGRTSSGCGHANSATGPFYCPADEKLYIDLSFYKELNQRFKAPGDFAMAYVVAHEVAHHVQHLLGITGQVQGQRNRISKTEYNKLMVRLELQADFLAGVWAHHGQQMKGFLEKGDIEEAMNAAHAIGDDRIQMEARGYVVPDSFTHGTSEQRMRWFRKGLETGDLSQGDTFDVPESRL